MNKIKALIQAFKDGFRVSEIVVSIVSAAVGGAIAALIVNSILK